MLIIGACGFAKEVLEVLYQLNKVDDIIFYDDINNYNKDEKIYNSFKILRTLSEAKDYLFHNDSSFTIGIGNPVLRKKTKDKFENIGGVFTSIISPLSRIGHYRNSISVGCNIMTGTVVTSNVKIKEGALINLNCTVGHDCIIGRFVELSPGVNVSGNCVIGDYSTIGTNATILPNITIGKNVVIGAGAVVNKNIPDNVVAVGVPSKIIKQLPKLEI
ncbi:sugar O-acyltransferase (sialic acid O-acetyltransferase NeuD family) [Lutibacter sp. Hel_I_33_5]|uniref:acetyltransferase n=1 Tax=Lutibacter sp. Hel_I_33_5 TaxID=1566289 RepID=UPI0011A95CF8|nr:acetyltransferase [Lutibacter sp. Hel_I_33_5]TVZ54852.1 sugar O-acyltransferase (sialic acid O-acetyltransferase NeuD family) [Lutibacter sp. Hel_I_33_5]